METRLHNIKCLTDGTPTSEENSSHSKCVTVSMTYCNTLLEGGVPQVTQYCK